MVQAYRQQGVDFLLRVFEDPSILEDITGITEMLQRTPEDLLVELEDEEEEEQG